MSKYIFNNQDYCQIETLLFKACQKLFTFHWAEEGR